MQTAYPQLIFHLAIADPLLLTSPNLHWLLGSSFTTDASRARLKAIAALTIGVATWLNPEAQFAILLLRVSLLFLECRSR